jgi:hypothetical protein
MSPPPDLPAIILFQQVPGPAQSESIYPSIHHEIEPLGQLSNAIHLNLHYNPLVVVLRVLGLLAVETSHTSP